MRPNRDRPDLSEWLIHFTRKVDLAGADAMVGYPEEWGSGNLVEGDDVASPFFLLRCILRRRQILSTWSIRGGNPTIYGPHPAVCFTEMPLAEFITAGPARAAVGEHASGYAIVLRKSEVFAAGGRPAIYGLSTAPQWTMMKNGTRCLRTDILPLREQYRYVAYDASRGGGLDWTHEREWRWPNCSWPFFEEYVDPPPTRATEYHAWIADRERGRSTLDGLSLDPNQFSQIGFVVKTQRQQQLLVHDILRLVDSRVVPATLFTFILRIDRWPVAGGSMKPTAIEMELAKHRVRLAPYFAMTKTVARAIVRRFDLLVKRIAAMPIPSSASNEVGGCWLWLKDNTHSLTRALVALNRVQFDDDGRYLVSLNQYPDNLSLRAREDMTISLARLVLKSFGADTTYYSVLGSDDANATPSYAGIDLADERYFNLATEPGDF